MNYKNEFFQLNFMQERAYFIKWLQILFSFPSRVGKIYVFVKVNVSRLRRHLGHDLLVSTYINRFVISILVNV